MRKIFISYRRDDSPGYTGRLYDHLIKEFSPDNIILDIDTIPVGCDFNEFIKDSIEGCDFFLAVIGKHYLIENGNGNPRIFDADDPVRLELALAKQFNLTIIPLLVDGASMPPKSKLPPDLHFLSDTNAFELQNKGWNNAVSDLITILKSPLKHTPNKLRSIDTLIFLISFRANIDKLYKDQTYNEMYYDACKTLSYGRDDENIKNWNIGWLMDRCREVSSSFIDEALKLRNYCSEKIRNNPTIPNLLLAKALPIEEYREVTNIEAIEKIYNDLIVWIAFASMA